MGSSTDVLNAARRFLDAGTREDPWGSNRVRGITDQGGFYPAAWCNAFVLTCLRAGGVAEGPHTMWVSTTMNHFRGQRRNFTEPRQAQPGDLVAFEWGTTAGGYDHIGFVEYLRADGIVTIEGNIGDRVQRIFRGWTSGMAEFARPAYDRAVSIPPSVTPPGTIAAVYRIGSRGEFVKNIQLVVGAVVDGVYGPNTASAVRIWQSKIGVSSDGVWGPATQAATARLFAYISATAAAPGLSAEATRFLTALSNASKRVLRMGDRGEEVRLLQHMLILRGVPVGGGTDGVFGPGTNHAVVAFQGQRRLTQDGIVGPRTWNALIQN